MGVKEEVEADNLTNIGLKRGYDPDVYRWSQ